MNNNEQGRRPTTARPEAEDPWTRAPEYSRGPLEGLKWRAIMRLKGETAASESEIFEEFDHLAESLQRNSVDYTILVTVEAALASQPEIRAGAKLSSQGGGTRQKWSNV